MINHVRLQFLRDHPKVFQLDDKRVRLVEQSCEMDVDDCEITDMDYESSQTEPLASNGHDPAEHWFCFDDVTVTPVTRQHIQKHYGQSDCAYMLFYRQKSRKTNAMECTNSMNVSWLFTWTKVDF